MYTKIEFELPVVSEYNQLCKQVKTLVGKPPAFEFSIISSYDSDDGFYVNHPNLESQEPVVEGKVQFHANYWRINESGAVSTPILENPTWKDILTATNDLLEENKASGIFLESLVVTNVSKGIKQVELEFGS
jgi:hypothetical protein